MPYISFKYLLNNSKKFSASNNNSFVYRLLIYKQKIKKISKQFDVKIINHRLFNGQKPYTSNSKMEIILLNFE